MKTCQAAGTYQLATRDTLVYLPEPLPITSLEARANQGSEWHSLMTDEPRNWYAMLELGFRAHGKVLVGGLGLGLVLWTLEHNPAVQDIAVVEQAPGVVDLVDGDRRLAGRLIVGDFFAEARKLYAAGSQPDTIMTDIAPTDPKHPEHGRIFGELQGVAKMFPKALHLHHGYQKFFDTQAFMRAATKTDYNWMG